jgi:hypothetical protein
LNLLTLQIRDVLSLAAKFSLHVTTEADKALAAGWRRP